MNPQRLIDQNIRIHDRVAKVYEKMHVEIFNDTEQERLHTSLAEAISMISSRSHPVRALDYGCGSGNLTRHLLKFNIHVTAADVSAEFLRLVVHRYGTERLDTIKITGADLKNIPDQHFDFIAMYSVLHHIPDYLSALKELAGKVKAGGVIYIDHERNDEFWSGSSQYKAFIAEASNVNWKKFLHLPNYIHKLKRLRNPRHTNEGDIHVWPDDHIEWKQIEELFIKMDFEVVMAHDFLLFSSIYKEEVFNKYKDKLTDTRVMAFRKK